MVLLWFSNTWLGRTPGSEREREIRYEREIGESSAA